MAAAVGVFSLLGMGSTSTVDQALEYQSESLALRENFIDTSGIRGTRSHPSERVRRGQGVVGGSISCTPSPLELSYLLPKILGGNASGTSYPLAETLPEFYVAVDRITKVFVYDGCKVNQATFSASVGGPLSVSLDVMGKDETVGNSGTFPSLTLDVAAGPFILSDCALTVGGTTYQFAGVDVTINNALEPQFFNSNRAQRFNETDRVISVSLSTPYGDSSALYGPALGGVAVVLTFTNGTVSLTLSMAKVQIPKQSPVVGGRGEIMLPLQGIARKSGSTLELVTTLDSTV